MEKYEFSWDVLDAIIGGKSLIDLQDGLTGFKIQTPEDAERFLGGYGFDLVDPIEKAEALGFFQESISFIRKYFLVPENSDGLKLEIPRKIVEITDTKDLILMAGQNYPGQSTDTQGVLLRKWACSLLKVMHTVSFIDKDPRAYYFTTVQKQILDRFYKMIHRDENENLVLGLSADDPLGINLVAFETKPKKSRESILLKLLHKPENVAEELFDQVGLRFVTKDRVSALRLVKFLKDNMLIMAGNIKPSRSRNTLIDIESVKSHLPQLLEEWDQGKISEIELKEKLENFSGPADLEKENPHSSKFFRSIQFTVRQQIKIKNPAYGYLRQLKSLGKKIELPGEVRDLLEKIKFDQIQREVRLFYPFEVQIFDEESAVHANEGASSHVEYKKAQVYTALKRVMGSFLDGSSAH